MKISCDKCGNEFVIKQNIVKNQSFMMRCPVCRNLIRVKRIGPPDYARTDNKNNSVVPNQHPSNMARHAGTDIPYDKVCDKHAAREGDLNIQREMISQIENGSDNIVESFEEFVDDARVEPGRGPQKNEHKGHWFTKLADKVDISYIAGRCIPYVYYTAATLVVFTALFLVNDFIKLNGITHGIPSMVIRILNDVRHYI